MKSLFVLLLASGALSAQTNNPLLSTPITFGNAKVYFQTPYFVNPSIHPKQAQFVAYNQVTNSFQGGNANAARLQVQRLNSGVIVDSFNPNGAANFEQGVISGALNLIFNGNTGRSFLIR